MNFDLETLVMRLRVYTIDVGNPKPGQTKIEKLQRRLMAAQRRDSERPIIDGWPAGGNGGPSSNEPSNRTLATVMAIEANEWQEMRPDPVHQFCEAAVGHFVEAMGHLKLAMNALDGLAAYDAKQSEKTSQAVARCAEDICDTPTAPGRSGRCEPCYRWLYRWRQDHPGQQPPAVPDEVIMERTRTTIREIPA